MKLFLSLASTLVRRGTARSLGCWLSILVAFILYGAASALNRSLVDPTELRSGDRLIVAHRHSRQQSLPLQYLAKIEAVAEVNAVSPRQTFGGWYQKPEQTFSQYIVDPERDLAVHQLKGLTAAQERLFLSSGDSVLVDQKLAERFGWRVGQRIRLGTSTWRQADGSDVWDFLIAGIYHGESSDTMLIARDYFVSKVPYAANLVGWYVVKCERSATPADIADQIDTMFSQNAAPTLTSSARAYSMYMARQFGEFGRVSIHVAFAVFVSLVISTSLFFLQSVSANKAQFAMLRVVGVPLPNVVGLLLTGTIMFCLPPALIGLALAQLATPIMARQVSEFLPGIMFSPATYGTGFIVAIVIALLSSVLIYRAVNGYSIEDLQDE